MNKIIKFTDSEVAKVIKFAKDIKWKHKPIHFMDSRNTLKRNDTELLNAIIEGKLAEVAVYKYLKEEFPNKNITEVDFNIYEVGVCDDGDIKIDGKVISIKSSKPYSSCLMMECERFSEGETILVEKDLPPDFICFVKVESQKPNKYAEICGFISFDEYWEIKKYIPRGFKMCRQNAVDYLINNKSLDELNKDIGGSLLADNYGIHISKLKDVNILNKE